MRIWLLLFLLSPFSLTYAQNFSIHLKQAPVTPTLQLLAQHYQKNVVINDDINQTVSLQLNNTHFDQVIQSVAKINQLHTWKEQDIYYLSLTDKTSLGRENLTLIESDIHSTSFHDMTGKALPLTPISLHYAKASDIMHSLVSGKGSMLSPLGSMSFDERSNIIFIQDIPSYTQKLHQLIQQLDKPIQQIAIEARIVTISDESLKELGVQWGILDGQPQAHKVTGSLNVNFPVPSLSAASMALQIAKIQGRLLDLELSALEQENNVKIIASPRLLTTNKKSASIKQGTEIPYVIVNKKDHSESVAFREAVLGLEVTPHLSKDNQILLDLVISQNSPGKYIAYGEGELVSIDKQEINTQVFAKDGETIVLGGVFHEVNTQGVDKVPLLGDIPGLKHLFSKESTRRQKRELVIFVTPRIVMSHTDKR